MCLMYNDSFMFELIRMCHGSFIWHPTDISTHVEEAKGGLLVNVWCTMTHSCLNSFVCAMAHLYDIPQISVRMWRRQRAVSLYVRQAFNSLACSLTAWIEVFWSHVPWLLHVLHDSDSCISAMAHLYISWLCKCAIAFVVTHSYVPWLLCGLDWGVFFAWLIAWVNVSCLTWMSHVPYEWVMSHMNESCLTTHWYATCIMTHSYTPCLIHMCHHFHDSLTCLQRGNMNFMNLSYVPSLMNMSHSCAEQVETWVTEAPYARASLGYL